jgi:hypothetical protein
MVACWILLVKPEVIEEHWFKHTLFDPKSYEPGAITKLLPITPTDML